MQPDYEQWSEEPTSDRPRAWRTVLMAVVVIGVAFALRGSMRQDRVKELPKGGYLMYDRDASDPRMYDFLHRGARALEKGDLDAAEVAYREMIEKFPKSVNGYECLACTLSYSKRYDEATAEYWRALEINPRTSYSHFGLGTIAYKQDRLREALACYKQALQIEEKWDYVRAVALTYDGLGDRANAVTHYERALAMGSNRPADMEYIKKRIEALKK